jgi:hypothetical protein
MAKEARMAKRAFALVVGSLLIASIGFAKDKAKSTLPAYVLTARTVAVVIDPDAGISIDDPQANRVAQQDVETALLNWGRFDPHIGTQDADLIIVVRRGHGQFVDRTISDPRQGDRPGAINSTDDGLAIGVQHGPPPPLSGGPIDASTAGQPHTQSEIGGSEDSFTVYKGGVENPLDTPAVWRYVGKDGLRPHSVPAVEQFKKAVAEAEKAAAKQP